jgi:hypothetical protein
MNYYYLYNYVYDCLIIHYFYLIISLIIIAFFYSHIQYKLTIIGFKYYLY